MPHRFPNDDLPLRAELFSVDQMGQHGSTLAASHHLKPGSSRNILLARLDDNERVLLDVYELLTGDVKSEHRVTPAGEWLLDNFYLIQEQINTARRHLPKGYSRELPRLASGLSLDLPRVYDIALETIAHGDGRVDPDNLSRFIASYQSVNVMKLGELWAIPIMLRLALIENLRRVAQHIEKDRAIRLGAARWAEEMMEVAQNDPKNLILTVADMARSNPPLGSAFVAEMARRLQGQSPALTLPITWIEQRLVEGGLTIEEAVLRDNQEQAANQVSISNSIGSLRALGAMDWREFVETMSVVEQTLLEDPGDVYGKMDFVTRDNYRHAVEYVAKHSRLSEVDVAREAIALAREGAAQRAGDAREAHVGFYLVDKGRAELERRAQTRFAPRAALDRFARKFPLTLYVGGVLAITAMVAVALVARIYDDALSVWLISFVALISVFSGAHLAVALTNWIATVMIVPRPLPRMDFSKGIPPEARTLVAVPTMLASEAGLDSLVEALEVRFLGNRDEHLHFALLTDFPDASAETLPTDARLLEIAAQKIDGLNEKYATGENDRFFLFHRPRLWNEREGKWMGFERKRGKLSDLNAYLRGGARDRFSRVVGETDELANVRFVITLDSDTILARDSARQFVGAMAHPLNEAIYDDVRRRIVDGYGILQPQVAVSLPGALRSRYARLWSNEPGIDPYTRTVSDVYQDLFEEGSFIGKGIYEVDAFDRAIKGRFPDNRILSHDLLEGSYARAGLMSDVPLYEEYPPRYIADASRRHRWIRGDWQIALWATPFVRDGGGRLRKNPISMLSRWKIFDNLRRSLTPAALVILFALGWTVLPNPQWWTLAALCIIALPAIVDSLLNFFEKSPDATLARHFESALRTTAWRLALWVFNLACLPHEAFYSIDAILRTAWRMLASHRRLLEWTPFGMADRDRRNHFTGTLREMWFAPALAVGLGLWIALQNPTALGFAAPFLALWFFSPLLAWWLSQPVPRAISKLSEKQTRHLRKLARKTWAFFETFVGPEDNWLPPDNFQEHPIGVIAHRTSPTNIGLSLLANMSAYDFGAIGAGTLLARTQNTLNAMGKLERFRGHFYNWYDTQSLQPLQPLYVSSVDSGNLAGHLMTLRPGLLGLDEQKIVNHCAFAFLDETLAIIEDAASAAPKAAAATQFAGLKKALGDSREFPGGLAEAKARLEGIVEAAAEHAEAVKQREKNPGGDLGWWSRAFLAQCKDALDDLNHLALWLGSPGDLAARKDPALAETLDAIPTLRELAAMAAAPPAPLAEAIAAAPREDRARLEAVAAAMAEAGRKARERIALAEDLAARCEGFAQIEYDFLYDSGRHLLSIGFNVTDSRLDASFYDLLASEARLATFVAIAQGRLPQESWFALGRLLTTSGKDPVLLSWSGSMFEYLMPLLVMPMYENTLLDLTCKGVVAQQIEYGAKRSVPWGISESGYNAVDVHRNYQYRAFGVPGLGLKRGLAEDLVVAPYATALSLMVAPEAACENLERLAEEGIETRYGLYEAIDYTPARMPRGQNRVVIRSFMAHHQGMSLLALANTLLDHAVQRRFASDPLFQSAMLLLQERVPKVAVTQAITADLGEHRFAAAAQESTIRVFNTPETQNPEIQLLSNGRYHVMITNAGGGYSRWKDLAVTRWHADSACDNWGTFLYIRDAATGEYWSAAHQPTNKKAKLYEAIFSEGRAEYRVHANDCDLHAEIAVSPEDDIELRRVRLTNRASTRRTLDATSYAEPVLATPASDAAHPAFGKLFVETEIAAQQRAIFCTRRPRARNEQPPFMLHMMNVRDVGDAETSFETDRMRFIGRGNTPANPVSMHPKCTKLSNTQGAVLDPIVAIRCRFTLEPGESVTINVLSGMGETREAVMALAEKYQDWRLADRVFDLAWTHGQVLLRQFNATEGDAQLYARLAGSIVYPNAALRAEPAVIAQNQRGQSGLWGYAISGDLPIVLLRIEDGANIELVRQLVQAHAYWRLKGLAVDLVIWNEDHAGYRQMLHEQIMGIVASSIESSLSDRPGGIFVRQGDQIAEEDRVLIQSCARAVISDGRGTLAEQVGGRNLAETAMPVLSTSRTSRSEPAPGPHVERKDLLFYNGIGGFTQDGREYVINAGAGRLTPTPWANVIANAHFGTVVSEAGMACTWSENAHEFRLTPWANDPVSDGRGEAYYLRDEERGHFWSPTPLPAPGASSYITRHGFGYSVFEHAERGIRSEMWVYVATDAPVKFVSIKVRNESDRTRKLSATGYVEWVLGDLRGKSSMHIVTETNQGDSAIYARNAYNAEFRARTAFFDVDDPARTFTGDRLEFLGRNGAPHAPAAMRRTRLSNKLGAGLDPCAAIRVGFELAPGQEREIVFRLGAGRSADEAKNLAQRFRGPEAARGALEAVWHLWSRTLGTTYLETPDHAFNVMANGWLLYQTLSCRIWGRNATYQSGGAFGFRDQLQDVLALMHARPDLVREQILLSAQHQFIEGDVQHWWHPPAGRGVRTKCSDDYLWLPYVTCRYVLATGDTGVLDEETHFIQGRPVNADEESYYDLPMRSDESASLYEHCVRALVFGMKYGAHGLPLIGAGDWNDGMNLVGEHGKGESVWLAFFFYDALERFAEVARMRGDEAFATRCDKEAAKLCENVEQNAWDGEWYRRAYFDDGTPLGSHENDECQIDSIAQSWSVLSGAGDGERARQAMESLDKRLVRRKDKLIQLLDPPFDKGVLNPGYIKGYVPGVRENGGQYTHAAIWAVMAFARLGENSRAWELFNLINPVNHGRTPAETDLYKGEPYVLAGDVYGAPPHTGRGGWTWYTGSAGWMHQLILRALMGLDLKVDKLTVKPCLPPEWDGITLHYRYRETVYHIAIKQSREAGEELHVVVDGAEQPELTIPLKDDRVEHWVEITLCAHAKPTRAEQKAVAESAAPAS